MSFDEAMDDETLVSRSEAIRECKRHNHEPADMLAALGDHHEYKSRDVLIWLGY